MENSRLKILIPFLTAFSVLTGCILIYLVIAVNSVSVESLRNDSFFVYDQAIQINDFNLTDHKGEKFTQERLRNKWTLAFFGYTFCPDICPLTMASIKQFHDLLEEQTESADVQVIMISVDPNRDTPEKLSSYVGFFNPSFIGLTGEYASLYSMAREMNIAFSYVRVDDENYLVNHNGEILLLDPEGDNVGFFKPPYQPGLMMENFLAMKKFASK